MNNREKTICVSGVFSGNAEQEWSCHDRIDLENDMRLLTNLTVSVVSTIAAMVCTTLVANSGAFVAIPDVNNTGRAATDQINELGLLHRVDSRSYRHCHKRTRTRAAYCHGSRSNRKRRGSH
ncbi:MAG: hypothetical protein ACR2PG_18630 [Hyphomicrobiaceae bacterium]